LRSALRRGLPLERAAPPAPTPGPVLEETETEAARAAKA